MQTTTAKLYSLEYNNARTYGFSALFIAGNILLPQLCHTIHLGGLYPKPYPRFSPNRYCWPQPPDMPHIDSGKSLYSS